MDEYSDDEGYSRRGVPLEPQTRLCIQNVRDYFMKERDNQGPLISVNKVVERVAAACNVSKHTVSKICKEIADGKYAHKRKVKKMQKNKPNNGEPSSNLSPMEEKLIECVRSREFLYYTKAPGYGDRLTKDNAWREIANELQSEPETCKRTWDRLRRNYVTVVKKIGYEEVQKLPLWTFEQKISFLLPYLRVTKKLMIEQPSGLLDLTGTSHVSEERQPEKIQERRRDEDSGGGVIGLGYGTQHVPNFDALLY